MNSRECEKCGASLEKGTLQCAYCGTWYESASNQRAIFERQPPGRMVSIINLGPGVGEFGIASNSLFVIGTTIAFALYVLGWLLEDTQYWLDETAMLVWIGILPGCLFTVALLWQAKRKVVLYGFAMSLTIFLVHVLLIWLIRGSLWDDHVGIAALVAGASLVGWLLGRLVHAIIRWRNAQASK